jgi:serine/threonine protein kinase
MRTSDRRQSESVLCQLLAGQNFVHGSGVIHRDIKPHNVFVKGHLHMSILDFELAVKINPQNPPSGRAGTLMYKAPEMASAITYTEKIDVWSLGLTVLQVGFSLPKQPMNDAKYQSAYMRLWTSVVANHVELLDEKDDYIRILQMMLRLESRCGYQHRHVCCQG